MLPALTVLAASYVAFAAHSTQISGQPPARLCSPADARTHAAARPPCMLAKVEADALIDEINHEHQEELRAVAWKKGPLERRMRFIKNVLNRRESRKNEAVD